MTGAAKVRGEQSPGASRKSDEAAAASHIQRVYRGYRTRRQLRGYGLDASTRWSDAVKEAQFRKATEPRWTEDEGYSDAEEGNGGVTAEAETRDSKASTKTSNFARDEWRRLAHVARKAHHDDGSDSTPEGSLDAGQSADRAKREAGARHARAVDAQVMGLQYFLEMTDEKHRYGSHLRSYHAAWMKSDTRQNFFYWLDHGEGKDVELEQCSRERLEKDQVRYLSREERFQYLVKIDREGRLRWAKNDEKITTNYRYRDSLEGIVPQTSSAPTFREEVHGVRHEQQDPAADSRLNSLTSESSEDSTKEGQHYINRDMEEAKGLKKLQHVSAAALLNHLLQSTTKKNTWIFLADTSFRLYVGIKQSGSFQHSSFVQGGRILAAGLIKVKDGQLRSLSPLSGHYRPPTRNFRAFVHGLKEAGCDMSRVSISKSYAILLGLEAYIKTKQKTQSGLSKAATQAEKAFKPEVAKERKEREKDNSESAKKEQEWLARQRQEGKLAKREKGWRRRLGDRFGVHRHSRSRSRSRSDAENAE